MHHSLQTSSNPAISQAASRRQPAAFPLCALTGALLVSAAFTSSSFGANTILGWDANTSTTGAQDGTGTWDPGSTANWWNGTADGVWPNASGTTTTAVIGTNSGPAGTITVSGTVSVNTIQFNAPGSGSYMLSGGILSMGGTSPTIKIGASSVAATINSVIADGSSASSITFSDGNSTRGTITLGGANTYTGGSTLAAAKVSFNILANGGLASSFGAAANTVAVVVGNSGSYAQANYTGGGGITDRPWTINGAATGNTINNNGTGAISFNNTGPVMSGSGNRYLTLGGNYIGSANTFAEQFTDLSGSTTALTIGGSIWNLTGANTHSGPTTINGGTLQLGSATAMGGTFTATPLVNQYPVLVGSGATLDLNGQTVNNRNITLNGGSLVNNNATTSASLNGTSSGGVKQVVCTAAGSGISGDATLSITGGGGSGATATASLGITPNTFTIVSGGSYTVKPTGATISGGGATATATVTLTFSGSSPYSITGITVNNAGSGYLTAPTITLTGGTGTAANITGNANNFTVVSTTVTAPGSGYTSQPTVSISSGTGTGGFAGQVLLDNDVHLISNSTVGGSGNTIISESIVGSGSLTKSGPGTLTLSGANTYTGGTTISAGTLDLGATSQSLGAVTISGASTIQNGTLTGTSFSSTLASGNTAFVSASLAGSGAALTHSGGGILTLSGANTFGGAFNINGGTVAISALNNLGAGNSITFGGSTSSTISLSQASGTTVTIPSTTTITVNSGSTATFKENSSGTSLFEVAALITGAGNCGQGSSSGAGVKFDNDANNYTGNFSMGYGTVQFTSVANSGAASSLGAGSTSYTIGNSASFAAFQYVGSGSTTTRNINWTATTGPLTLDSSGTGPVQFLGAGNLRSGSGDAPLTLQGSNTGNNTLAQVINNGAVSGNTSVTKSGVGTWILAGANTYSGATTVNGGTLLINGALMGAGAVTVQNTATLGGNGTIAGAVTVNASGTLAPGASANTIGTLTLQASPTLSGALAMDINKSGSTLTSDQLALSGNNLAFGGALIVTATGDALAANDAFNLVSGSGTLSGWFSSVSLPSLAAGLSWDTNKLATTGLLDIYSFTTTPVSLSTPKDTPAVVPGVKLNTFANSTRNTALRALSATAPANGGTASVDNTGTLTYTPASGFAGTDTFTLTYGDGHGFQTAAVTVIVGAGNGASLNVVSGPSKVDGNFVVGFAGIPGYTYTVETNSAASGPGWSKLGNFTVPADGIFQVTQPIGDGSSLFFRTVWPSY